MGIVDRLRNIYSKQGDSLENVVADAETMLDWITMTLALHSTGDQLTSWLGTDNIAVSGDEYPEPEIIYNEYGIENTEPTQEEDTAISEIEADKTMLRNLLDKFAFEYDWSGVSTPAKLTVTEITAAEKEKQTEKTNLSFILVFHGLMMSLINYQQRKRELLPTNLWSYRTMIRHMKA